MPTIFRITKTAISRSKTKYFLLFNSSIFQYLYKKEISIFIKKFRILQKKKKINQALFDTCKRIASGASYVLKSEVGVGKFVICSVPLNQSHIKIS